MIGARQPPSPSTLMEDIKRGMDVIAAATGPKRGYRLVFGDGFWSSLSTEQREEAKRLWRQMGAVSLTIVREVGRDITYDLRRVADE